MIDMPSDTAATLAVTIQGFYRGGVYRHKARFTQLRLSDDQSFRGDIVEP
jgi:hypothetical protein